MTFALNSKISDVVGCQNSGLGWVRMSPTKVRVRFRCQLLGFVWVRVRHQPLISSSLAPAAPQSYLGLFSFDMIMILFLF